MAAPRLAVMEVMSVLVMLEMTVMMIVTPGG
jgi:hypothetical protein